MRRKRCTSSPPDNLRTFGLHRIFVAFSLRAVLARSLHCKRSDRAQASSYLPASSHLPASSAETGPAWPPRARQPARVGSDPTTAPQQLQGEPGRASRTGRPVVYVLARLVAVDEVRVVKSPPKMTISSVWPSGFLAIALGISLIVSRASWRSFSDHQDVERCVLAQMYLVLS